MPSVDLGPRQRPVPVVFGARGDRAPARRRASGCARSLGGWGGRRRRSRGSCGATPRPAAASSSTGPRSRSGRPSSWPVARRPPSSPPTSACASMCSSDWRASCSEPDGTPVAGPDAGPWKGRNKPRRQDRRWATAWSPQQISERLQIDFPDDASMRISHEAIYQALYVQGRGALRRELVACLRTGRALRVPRARTRHAARRSSSPRRS